MPKLSLATKLSHALVPVTTTRPDIDERAYLAPSPRVRRLVHARLDIKAKIDALTAELKDTDAQLLDVATKVGGKIITDDWTLTKVDSHSSSINREKLMQLGVRLALIKEATVERNYSYALVTTPKKGAQTS